MINRTILTASLIVLFIYSCSRFENDAPDPYAGKPFLKGNGAFVINEGNFMAGNGSLSYFSNDSVRIFNNLFTSANGRPLGDIPYSMVIHDEKIYIIINNSGKIEIADLHDMQSLGTIKELNSPRNMLVINQDKAYVTSLFSNDITIINLRTNKVSGKINIRRSSEAIVMLGNNAYISCWSSGREVMVVNTLTDHVIDSVEVGSEPESMVLDKEKKLWVLCSGGYTGQYFPELLSINTSTWKVEKRFTFTSKTLYPSSLAINPTGDTLYYIGGSIWKMSIKASLLPVNPFIRAKGRLFYKIGVEPGTKRIFATNAVDYQQKGYLLRYNAGGILIDSAKADIIPGSICYKTGLK